MKKRLERLRSTNTHSPPATGNKDDDFSTQNKYKKFTNFLKESKSKQQQKNKNIAECNCWVCKILDSTSTSSVTNNEIDTTTSATKRYEPYNIVSESGDSIFYDPSLLSNINNDDFKGQIYVSVDRVQNILRDRDELAKKHFNGVNFNKNEY